MAAPRPAFGNPSQAQGMPSPPSRPYDFPPPSPAFNGRGYARTPSPSQQEIKAMSMSIKTEAGGESGMAGVGRRAFAMATALGMHGAGPSSGTAQP